MRIAVLGPLEVRTDDGVPVTVPGAKERLLLAILTAGAPGAVSFDALAESLWDGDLPATARKSLQIHVVRLRSSLEPDRPRGSTGRFVARRGPGYALTVPRDAVDALRIDDLTTRGRALLTSGRLEDAARELAAAVDLWRGEPYDDWPDAPFAEVERRRLTRVHAGAVAGLLEARLQLGAHAEVLPQLEGLVAGDPLREDWWRLLMLALYRAGRQADALAAGRRVRALLAAEIGAEPGPGLRAMEAAILAQDPALDAPPRTAPHPGPDDASPAPGACPYKGLAVYEAADAPLFHGRERLISSLVARLVDAPVLVVSGPSGAGKSSAVRAGLVPALADGGLPGSQSWRPVTVTPGQAPVDALAELTGDPSPAEPVLLVCDQFEELWAPGIDPAERTAFLDAVAGLVDDGIVVRCVVVVRGDHVGRLAEHPVFTERRAAFALVPPLAEAELREIVREPARFVGLRVDPELADSIVGDVLGQVGALPLLSTALVGTWERRRGDLLTLAGYLEAGGVAGALDRSAEAVYGALDDVGGEFARRLFVRLADTDDGGALVRRRVRLAELGLGDQGLPRRDVVEAFVGRRLLSVDEDRLEVAHEALLTAWPRLTRWLADDAVGRALRRHLVPAAREWDAAGRSDAELYRGARLAAALDWAAGADADLTPVEQDFLDASREAAQTELTAARRRADREAAARHRTRRLAGGLAAVLVVALVATFLAVRAQRAAVGAKREAVTAQREAQQASLLADAKRLAALSVAASSLDVALLLAVQAVRLASNPETQDALLAALTAHGRAERSVAFDGDPLVAYLANGGRTLFVRTEFDVITWSVGSSTQPEVALSPYWGDWSDSAPSPIDDSIIAEGNGSNGPWLRILHADGTSRVLLEGDEVGGSSVGVVFRPGGRRVTWLVSTPDPDGPDGSSRWRVIDVDAQDGMLRETGIGGTYPSEDLQVDFTDDGSSAVLWSDGATHPAIMIDLVHGRQTPTPVQNRPGRILEYRATRSGAAQLWLDGGVTVFDREGTAQQLAAHRLPVRDVVVAPDGRWGVTVGRGPLIVVWDIDPLTGRWSQREQLTGHAGEVMQAEVDPSGNRLITIGLDHAIITWDMTADAGFGTSNPGLDGRWIANRPQAVPGGLIVAPTRPRASPSDIRREAPGPDTLSVAATFLDPDTGEVVDQVVLGDTVEGAPFGSSVAVSPDRSKVAVTWGLGTTVLDTRTHDVIDEIVLPPNGNTGIADRPLPATVVLSSAWTPDGSTLLLGAERKAEGGTWSAPGGAAADGRRGGYLVPVDTRTWHVGRRIDIGGGAQAMETSPDEKVIAVANTADSELVILDAAGLDVERRLPLTPADWVLDLSFSPDGRFLAGSSGSFLYVFDTTTWQLVWPPARVHEGWALQTEWLDDGRTIATAGSDGTVALFDVERGVVRARGLPASSEATTGYTHLAPEPADELVVLGGDRSGRRYPVEPSMWLDEACAIVAGRDLTPAEWDRYLPGRHDQPTCSDLP
jgi:DNA-binding SARP family transcriptional activator/WD40 repeat protein